MLLGIEQHQVQQLKGNTFCAPRPSRVQELAQLKTRSAFELQAKEAEVAELQQQLANFEQQK